MIIENKIFGRIEIMFVGFVMNSGRKTFFLCGNAVQHLIENKEKSVLI